MERPMTESPLVVQTFTATAYLTCTRSGYHRGMQKHRKGREGSEQGSSPLLATRPYPGNLVCAPLFIFETKMSLLSPLYRSKYGWRELLKLTQTAMNIVIVSVILKQEGIGQDTILKKKKWHSLRTQHRLTRTNKAQDGAVFDFQWALSLIMCSHHKLSDTFTGTIIIPNVCA